MNRIALVPPNGVDKRERIVGPFRIRTRFDIHGTGRK
jgi:propanediol utilization protein